MAGWLVPPARAVHVNFGNVLGKDRKMLKSRSGDPMPFIDLVDEAVERGRASVAERSPDLTPDEQAELGRIIGVGALKYAELSIDRIKDYVFDWDRMLAFEGNTAPYLQYAHARIRSIFRRADVTSASVREVTPVIGEPQERQLAIRLLALRRRAARDHRALLAAPAVHLPVRPRAGLHCVLRGLPGAEGPDRRTAHSAGWRWPT